VRNQAGAATAPLSPLLQLGLLALVAAGMEQAGHEPSGLTTEYVMEPQLHA